MSEILDILLSGARNVNLHVPKKKVKMIRLSRELDRNVEFTLQALSFDVCADLAARDDSKLESVLRGVIDPDLGSIPLAQQLGILQPGEEWGAHGITKRDLVKALLLPGEIDVLAVEIEKLSGFRTRVISEVKN